MSSRLDFFRALFPEIPQNLRIHVRLIAGENDLSSNRGVKSPYVRLHWFQSIDELDAFEFPEDVNCYFGVGLRRPNDKAPVLWTALWADVDSNKTPSFEGFPAPSLIVRSGNGLHVYWLLAEPSTEAERLEFHAALRAIQQRIPHADPAAAEPARILRVPGTINVKRAVPVRCEVVLLEPDRKFTLSDFPRDVDKAQPANTPEPITPEPLEYDKAVFPPEEEWLRLVAWQGFDVVPQEKRGQIKSHSHLLWHVARALCRGGHTKGQAYQWMTETRGLIRNKERERPSLVADAIHDAWAWVEARRKADVAATAAGLVRQAGGLHKLDNKGEVGGRVANFDIEAHAVLSLPGNEGGGYDVSITNEKGRAVRQLLSSAALRSPSDWLNHVPPEYIWHGSATDLKRLQAYLNEKNVPHKQPTEVLGWAKRGGQWAYIITSREVYTRDSAIETAPIYYTGGKVWRLIPPGLSWRDDANVALSLLLRLHDPVVVWALLGWTMSTFVAPRLREARHGTASGLGEWSGLWVWGHQGAGKTETVREFLRLTSTPFTSVAPGSTLVGLKRTLASSNCVPVFLDDPRKRLDREDRGKLDEVLRAVLNGDDDTLSDTDRRIVTGTKTRTLQAPILVASEHAVEDDDAMEERYFSVPFRLSGKTDATLATLTALDAIPLEALTLGFYRHFWDMDVKREWGKAFALTEFLTAKGATTRRRSAIAQILLGLAMATDVAPGLGLGADEIEIAEALWTRQAREVGRNYERPEAQNFVRLVNMLDYLIAKGHLREGVAWLLKGDALYVVQSLLEGEIARVPDNGGLRWTKTMVAATLAAHDGGFVRFEKVRFHGEKDMRACVEFDLAKMGAELGITGGSWMNPSGVMV